MYEREVDSLKKWLKVAMIYMTANTSEEYHELLYSLWPIYQDAVKTDCGPVLNALKQELKEWIKGLEVNQRNQLQNRLANLHLEPEADTPDHDLERLLEMRRRERVAIREDLAVELSPEDRADLCPA